MVYDFHNDYLTDEKAFDILSEYESMPVKIISAVFKGKRQFKEILDICEKFKSINPQNSRLAFEDLGYDNIDEIVKLLSFNPIYCTLTWNGENKLGCGCGCSSGGLKSFGKDVIKILNERKICVDVAHINKQGFYDVLDTAVFVVNSHTAFCGVNQHIRNITDEQIRLIIERNGLIGLAFYSPFLNGKSESSIDDVIKHIDYFVQRFGYKNLCIGSDFFGANDFPDGLSNYSDFYKIENKLKDLGYTQSAINNILYNNLSIFDIDKKSK